MTEAMPFLQNYDITFLRPPPIGGAAFSKKPADRVIRLYKTYKISVRGSELFHLARERSKKTEGVFLVASRRSGGKSKSLRARFLFPVFSFGEAKEKTEGQPQVSNMNSCLPRLLHPSWLQILLAKKRGIEKLRQADRKALTQLVQDAKLHRIVCTVHNIADRRFWDAAFRGKLVLRHGPCLHQLCQSQADCLIQLHPITASCFSHLFDLLLQRVEFRR